ncbi:MAG: hypothetical protein PHP35_01975 [Candidatus Colwellbacteria bacterium]|nr:hypothetical protein [Candidatus Colwellbacteria bacterium]
MKKSTRVMAYFFAFGFFVFFGLSEVNAVATKWCCDLYPSCIPTDPSKGRCLMAKDKVGDCQNGQSKTTASGCGTPCGASSNTKKWTKYEIFSIWEREASSCSGTVCEISNYKYYFYDEYDDVCTTVDKCYGTSSRTCVREGTSNLLRAGNCNCTSGGIYKACCKTSDRTIATSTNYRNIDGHTPLEASCSSGGPTRVNEVSGSNRSEVIRCPSKPDVTFSASGHSVTKDASGNTTIILNPGEETVTVSWDAGSIRPGNYCKFSDQASNVSTVGSRSDLGVGEYTITCLSHYDFQSSGLGWVDTANPSGSSERREVSEELIPTSVQVLTVRYADGPIVDIQPKPPVCIPPSATITYLAQNATSCTLNGRSVPLSGSETASSAGDYIFSCVDDEGKTGSSSTTVTQINLSHPSVIDPSMMVECFDTNGNGKCEPSDACYREVTNPVLYTCSAAYTCSSTVSYPDKSTCESATGKTCYDSESSCSAVCTRCKDENIILTANPQTIRKNFESTTLTWSEDLGPGTSCTLKEEDATIATSTDGSMQRSPKEDTAYTFSCVNGSCNRTKTVNVTVVNQCTQANLIFTSSKSRVLKNQSATLSWSASNLDPNISCTLNGTPVSKEQASYPVGPISTTTTYRLSCSSGAECTQEKTLTIEAYEASLEEQ